MLDIKELEELKAKARNATDYMLDHVQVPTGVLHGVLDELRAIRALPAMAEIDALEKYLEVVCEWMGQVSHAKRQEAEHFTRQIVAIARRASANAETQRKELAEFIEFTRRISRRENGCICSDCLPEIEAEILAERKRAEEVRKCCPCNCHDQPSSEEAMGLKEHEHCGICTKALLDEAESMMNKAIEDVVERDAEIERLKSAVHELEETVAKAEERANERGRRLHTLTRERDELRRLLNLSLNRSLSFPDVAMIEEGERSSLRLAGITKEDAKLIREFCEKGGSDGNT